MTTRKLTTKNRTIRLAIRVRIAAHGPAWQTDGRVEQGQRGYLGPDRADEGPEEAPGCAGQVRGTVDTSEPPLAPPGPLCYRTVTHSAPEAQWIERQASLWLHQHDGCRAPESGARNQGLEEGSGEVAPSTTARDGAAGVRVSGRGGSVSRPTRSVQA